ncbi:ATP-binding protein [Halalkalibaculum sp. DA3122]|uniref:ATP-binding protein n=1 Tax=Halalkalibaculum sp. DA3122 TaxID=3373607 RepID=UPI0037553247
MSKDQDIEFNMTILGRTLEHMGVQMYKKRTSAIAELIANSWDAGAKNVHIELPNINTYSKSADQIVIQDDGSGMGKESIENKYLVIGRNRREEGDSGDHGRPVMGRKGIGKLAGFGISTKMEIITWTPESCIKFLMDIDQLKADAGKSQKKKIPGKIIPEPDFADTKSGTRVILKNLKHVTPLDPDTLHQSLARRFSRKVTGKMQIMINSEELQDLNLNTDYRVPAEGFLEEELSDGNVISYFYEFTKKPINNTEARGFTIYCRGKTAQAPNFYFGVEGTASGQHATKYLSGVIEADYLDSGTDSDSDLISTDRQEIDWEDNFTQPLHEFGEKITRKALREHSQKRGEDFKNVVLENENISERLQKLDKTSSIQAKKLFKVLGSAEPDPEKAVDLASSVLKAYEYQNFHDLLGDLETISDDPESLKTMLKYLQDWKVLESRTILEIIRGRLDILEKFQEMIIEDAPETAHKIGDDNFHDLLGGNPWILNPDWQVLDEEKQLSSKLKEWNFEDIDDRDKALRYDFFALSDTDLRAVIEIKRPGNALEHDDLQRLDKYAERLARAKSGNIKRVLIFSGNINFSDSTLENTKNRPDFDIRTWDQVLSKTEHSYEHYKAVLEGDIEDPGFHSKEKEVKETRRMLEKGIYRSQDDRSQGLGGQDVNYLEEE